MLRFLDTYGGLLFPVVFAVCMWQGVKDLRAQRRWWREQEAREEADGVRAPAQHA